MDEFGPLFRKLRKQAGLGLRSFAELMDDRASNISAIESGLRLPWQREAKLSRAADLLSVVSDSEQYRQFLESAHAEHRIDTNPSNGSRHLKLSTGSLAWWWTTDNAPLLDEKSSVELREFIGVENLFHSESPRQNGPVYPVSKRASITNTPAKRSTRNDDLFEFPAMTELAIEWRVKRLLGKRDSQITAAPVDVEAALERQADVRIEVIAGLIPRFSVQACVVKQDKNLVILVDRIVADSRPLASYRELLAMCFALSALWPDNVTSIDAASFHLLQTSPYWPVVLRDAERFALSMLLPAGPVLTAAEAAYREMVQQQGWVDEEFGTRAVRNRLAEQFAVPPLLVHKRLVRWPCHVYGRIAQALAAQEETLPPVDWFEDPQAHKQRVLFEKNPETV